MLKIFGTGKNRDLNAEEKLVKEVLPEGTPTSLDLYTISKIVGRECATQNKEFFMCKKEKGEKPSECEKQGAAVMICVEST